jgi:hypothetical protein
MASYVGREGVIEWTSSGYHIGWVGCDSHILQSLVDVLPVSVSFLACPKSSDLDCVCYYRSHFSYSRASSASGFNASDSPGISYSGI